MSLIHLSPPRHERMRRRARSALAVAVTGVLAGSVALVSAPTASAAPTPAEATEQTIEFESITSHGTLNEDPNLTEGEDYQDAPTKELQTQGGNSGRILNNVADGSWVRYQDVDLGSHEADQVKVTYDAPSTRAADPHIDFYVDDMNGSPIASADLDITGSGWGTYNTQAIDLDSDLSGMHDIYVKFTGDSGSQPYVGNFDSFTFVYATKKTVQFASIRSGDGKLDDDTSLEAGTDYHNGTDKHLATETKSHGPQLAGVSDGAWVRYQDIDLGSETANKIEVTYDAPSGKAADPHIDFYVDDMNGSPIASADLDNTGGSWGTFTTTTIDLDSDLSGKHDIYASFSSSTTATPHEYVGNFVSFALVYGTTPAGPSTPIAGDTVAMPISVTSNAANEGDSNEHVQSLMDANAATKWYSKPDGGGHRTPTESEPVYAIYTLGSATAITQYTMTSGGDSAKYPDRDPIDWQVLGSDDAAAATDADDSSWQVLDSESGQEFGISSLARDYTIDPGDVAPYTYYQLRITKVAASKDSTNMQLADWTLRVSDSSATSKVVTKDTEWSYLDDPTGAVDPSPGSDPHDWTKVGASPEGTWSTAEGPFGSKNGTPDLGSKFPVTTELPLYKDGSADPVIPAYFFRSSFTLDQSAADSIKSLYGTVLHDDAVTVYLNGNVILDHPGSTAPEGNLSYGGDTSGDPRSETFRVPADDVQSGENTVAVEVHNVNDTSSDIYFAMPRLAVSTDEVPVPYTPQEINASYPSDHVPSEPRTPDNPSGDFFIHLLNGFGDLQDNHPEILAPNQNLDSGESMTAVNDKVDVDINNGATGHTDKVDQAIKDATGAPYRTMSDGLGTVLGPIYSTALNRGALPKTSELLNNLVERGRNHEPAKAAFDYLRPYNRLGTTTGETCSGSTFSGTGRIDLNMGSINNYNGLCKNGSFPSGHTNHGYSQGTVLATLLPKLAPQILYRTSEYGNNRMVLGFHYPLDIMGGRMAGQVTAAQRWADPEFRDLIEQAQDELQGVLSTDCQAQGYSADLKQCADEDADLISDGDALTTYTERLSYSSYTLTDGTRKTDGFPVIYSGAKNTPEIVPASAADLLRTTFPDLTDPQRSLVLQATAIQGGYALDKTPEGEASWQRINLLAAMEADVSVNGDDDVIVNGDNMGEAAPDGLKVEFESITGEHNSGTVLLADESNLVEGTDYQEGSNGIDSNKDGLKTEGNNGGRTLSGVTDGAWVRYQDVDLGSKSADAMKITYTAPSGKAVDPAVEVYADSMNGTPLVTDALPITGSDWADYDTTTISLPTVLTGKHDLYFKFSSTPDDPHFFVGNFDSFELVYSTAPQETEKVVEFESIRSGNGKLSDDSSLVSGTDYEDGSNGVDSSKDGLKTENNNGGRTLSGVTTGAWVRYQDVDLGSNKALSLQVTYDSPSGKATDPQLKMYVDSMDGSPLVTMDLENTGSSWGTYTTVTTGLPTPLTGKHDLYMEFVSGTPDNPHFYVGNFDYFALGYTVDKSELNAAITAAQAVTDHPEWYDAGDYQVFSDALDAAESVAADEDATYDDVQDALNDLQQAQGDLQWTIVGELADLVAQAQGVDEGSVSADSYADLQDAIAAAQALDSDSSHADYVSAYGDLQDAMDALESMTSSTTTIMGASLLVDAGADVSFDVRVTSGATGTVDVVEGSATLTSVTLDGSSKAQVTVSDLSVGTHELTAHYLGDGTYKESTSESVTVVVADNAPEPDPVWLGSPMVNQPSQVWDAKKKDRVTLTSLVWGTTSGTVTFSAGSTVLGSAPVESYGSVYQATIHVPRALAAGSYGSVSAQVEASDGRTATSAQMVGAFTVAKAQLQKFKVKGKKKTKKHHKSWIKVKASKRLTNDRVAKGKVKIKVKKHGSWVQYKKRSMKKFRTAGGKLKIKIAKRFATGKKIRVKAVYHPKKSQKAGVKKAKGKVKTKVKK